VSRRLFIRPPAEIDIAESALWYEAERHGLGTEFLDAVDDLLRRVERNPLQFPEVGSDVRRGLLRRFPYGVYFVTTSETSVVLAVLHLHRDPGAWRNRATPR